MDVQRVKTNGGPPRRLRARAHGQSIVLIAMMIVLLVGMVALSVDVGNTYAESREATRATNAGAVAGMQAYLENQSDAEIYSAIEDAIKGNGVQLTEAGVDPASDDFNFTATYLDSGGAPLCEVGQCEGVSNVSFIRVVTEGKVNTYFARALGRDQLPVNVLGFAGRCPPINGVFPIAVKHNLIDPDKYGPNNEGFASPDGVATLPDVLNPTQKERHYKRVYTGKADLLSSQTTFGFLRWKPEYGKERLAPMLQGNGELSLGFEEVPEWPEETIDPPPGYPSEPGYLTYGDWVYGFESDPADPNPLIAIQDELEFHKRNRSKMILPLYGVAFTQDDKAVYYIEQFGEFYLDSYGDSEEGYYLDLIFLRYTPLIPCPAENVEHPSDYGLIGNVFVTPRWGEVPQEKEPAGYAIMLDVSGSMSWNFQGLGSYRGQDYQCEAYDPDIPLPYAYNTIGDCRGGPRAYWRTRTDRRAYAAREALVEIVDRMEPDDRIRIVAFSNSVEKTSSKWYDPGDLGLIEHIRTIAEYKPSGEASPTYLTNGGTNGATALNKASDFLRNGFPSDLRPVAIYMTDGVSNHNHGYSFSDQNSDGCKRNEKPACRQMGCGEAINTAYCQIGETQGKELPITQMQSISREMHNTIDDLSFYVLAMGRLDTTGLDQVATHPDMLFAARQAEQVQQLLDQIKNEVQYGDCVPQVDEFDDYIDGEQEPDWSNITGYNPPPLGVFGYVIITKDGGQTPIEIFHENGRLVYKIEGGLEPGVYQIVSAWIGYNANGDAGGTRIYDLIIDPDKLEVAPTITFSISQSPTLGSIAGGPDIYLDLRGGIDALCNNDS